MPKEHDVDTVLGPTAFAGYRALKGSPPRMPEQDQRVMLVQAIEELASSERRFVEVRDVLEEALGRTPDPARSTAQLARELANELQRANAACDAKDVEIQALRAGLDKRSPGVNLKPLAEALDVVHAPPRNSPESWRTDRGDLSASGLVEMAADALRGLRKRITAAHRRLNTAAVTTEDTLEGAVAHVDTMLEVARSTERRIREMCEPLVRATDPAPQAPPETYELAYLVEAALVAVERVRTAEREKQALADNPADFRARHCGGKVVVVEKRQPHTPPATACWLQLAVIEIDDKAAPLPQPDNHPARDELIQQLGEIRVMCDAVLPAAQQAHDPVIAVRRVVERLRRENHRSGVGVATDGPDPTDLIMLGNEADRAPFAPVDLRRDYSNARALLESVLRANNRAVPPYPTLCDLVKNVLVYCEGRIEAASIAHVGAPLPVVTAAVSIGEAPGHARITLDVKGEGKRAFELHHHQAVALARSLDAAASFVVSPMLVFGTTTDESEDT